MDNKNLINQPFGKWTVIGDCITFKNKRNRTERKWLCRCECGTERYVLERSLIYGGSQSCGCMSAVNSAKAVSYNLKDKTFGDLKVLYEKIIIIVIIVMFSYAILIARET